MMTIEQHNRSHSKPTKTSDASVTYPTLTKLQQTIPINPQASNVTTKQMTPIIKDLRHVNLLNELYPLHNNKSNIQETVEVVPQPVSCERVFYSYINDQTDLRLRECIKLNQNISLNSNNLNQMYSEENIIELFDNTVHDQRLQLEFYSTTLFIFPKQRNEKFISEIHYIPAHVAVRYTTTLDLLATTMTSAYRRRSYENVNDFYRMVKDIFYRI